MGKSLDPDAIVDRVAAGRGWLEGYISSSSTAKVEDGGFFHSFTMHTLRVSATEPGRALCTLRVPPHLVDAEGIWHPGSIATVIDDVGAAAIATTEGRIKVSVDFAIAYFASAKLDEEMKIEARVVGHKGKLSAVVVEVRKQGSGELVALGQQWMASPGPALQAKL